jgi:hypothetical protein
VEKEGWRAAPLLGIPVDEDADEAKLEVEYWCGSASDVDVGNV